jgi:hypothetical protein
MLRAGWPRSGEPCNDRRQRLARCDRGLASAKHAVPSDWAAACASQAIKQEQVARDAMLGPLRATAVSLIDEVPLRANIITSPCEVGCSGPFIHTDQKHG